MGSWYSAQPTKEPEKGHPATRPYQQEKGNEDYSQPSRPPKERATLRTEENPYRAYERKYTPTKRERGNRDDIKTTKEHCKKESGENYGQPNREKEPKAERKEKENRRNTEKLIQEEKLENMKDQIINMEKQIKRMEDEKQKDDFLKRIYLSRNKLLTRRPEKHFKDQTNLNICLFGEMATGKTALINSLKYAVSGTWSSTYMEQTAPENFQGAHTIQGRKIALTDHLNVIDTRGVNAEHFGNPSFLNDVIRQMEGKRTREVTQVINISAKEKSYCALMVFSAHQKDTVMACNDFILKLFEWQGRYPLAVITHVDEESSEHVRLALGSIGIGDIYDVANITNSKKELELTYQFSLLELLEKCFIYGDEICAYRHEMKEKPKWWQFD